MPRPFVEKQLVIATHNAGKLSEFKALLSPYGIEVTSAGALGLPDPEETGTSFAENALIKAQAASAKSGLPALGDDSGLCVTALNGAPGIYSARWCGPNREPTVGMARIQKEMQGATDLTASFVCALALVWPDGAIETVEGVCAGRLVFPARGDKGHGFDPWFLPDGQVRTFGEMGQDEKATLSHRGRAMDGLLRLFS